MRLTFFGAAGGEVTGSCYLLETERARVLVDFGLHQGAPEAEALNRRPPPLNAPKLDAIVLTHAHLDHSGLLPLLAGASYPGRIYCTPASMDLAAILLEDSARIQEGDAQELNEERHQEGLDPIRPLYGLKEVEWTLSALSGVPYWEWKEIAPGVKLRFADAGHIIGSAIAELIVEEGGQSKRVVFSGDIGPRGAPLVRDPTELRDADVLILESTYGDRDHKCRADTIEEFRGVIEAATQGNGKVLIPAFAVGRTQDMIFELGKLKREGKIDVPVLVDSPMAIETTELYRRHRSLFDGEAAAMLGRGETPLRFDGLQYVKTARESRELNSRGGGIVIIAGSGMCTGGRILFHLRHGLGDPQNHVVFVGYQAEGTLGRRLVDREKFVEVLGRRIEVRAQVHTIGGFSAHAGQSGLVAWAEHFEPKPKRVFLTHGENKARAGLCARLKSEVGIDCELPAKGQAVEI
jgi:metallo-beta-lactamase family protein